MCVQERKGGRTRGESTEETTHLHLVGLWVDWLALLIEHLGADFGTTFGGLGVEKVQERGDGVLMRFKGGEVMRESADGASYHLGCIGCQSGQMWQR